MKKNKKLLVTASLVSAAVTLGGCRFLPWENGDQPVYGVPMAPTVTLKPVPGYETEEEKNMMPESEILPDTEAVSVKGLGRFTSAE